MSRNFPAEEGFDLPRFSRRMARRAIARSLEMEVTRIQNGTERRIRAQKLRRSIHELWDESANDWLSCEIYLLVRRLKRIGHLEALNDAVKKAPVRRKGQHDISEQPFKLALFLIFGDLMVLHASSPLSRNKRSELGDALAYADVHNVPAKYLNGFIKQAGMKECRAKLKELHVEPRFDSRADVI